MKILVTGAEGLLGLHARALLFSENASAKFCGKSEPFEIVSVNRSLFNDSIAMHQLLHSADAVLHFAGVNRGGEQEVANGNLDIARTLVSYLEVSKATPHVVYSNSTHSEKGNAYGIGKQAAADEINKWALAAGARFTDVVFPHIFGEGARPFYNTVTATLCHQIVNDEVPEINPEGFVELLHAGSAASFSMNCVLNKQVGRVVPKGKETSIVELYEKLQCLYANYKSGLMPKLADPFEVQLFNTLRAFMYPDFYPKKLDMHCDTRGELFEAVKGGQGQTFLSWTKQGISRGDHFHLNKVERFLVVSGEATIRIRHIFSEVVQEFKVVGDEPAYVDMPTLHTHSIENSGTEPLLTLFWSHEIFDPETPDTFAEPVLK